MGIGRLLERFLVEVRADMTGLGRDLNQGVTQTKAATQNMARSWSQVERRVNELTSELVRGKITQSAYMTEMNKLSAKMKVVAGSFQQAQKQVFGFSRAAKTAQFAVAPAFNPRPINAFTRSTGQARAQVQNLGFQINDIGQTLATGMNPFTVMVQQGSQILQIYAGQGGLKTAIGDVLKILRSFARFLLGPIGIAIGAVVGAVGLLNREVNKTTDTSVSFMDTTKAVFQVVGGAIWDLIRGPVLGIQKAFGVVLDWIGKWFPRVMNGIIKVAVVSVKVIGATWDALPDLFSDAFAKINNKALTTVQDIINFITQDLVNGVLDGVNRIIQAFKFGLDAVKLIWSSLPKIMENVVAEVVNRVVEGSEKLVNSAIEGINKLINGVNSLIKKLGADSALKFFGFKTQLDPIAPSDLGEFKLETEDVIRDVMSELGTLAGETFSEDMMKGIGGGIEPTNFSKRMKEVTGAFGKLGEEIKKILDDQSGANPVGKFFDAIRTQAIANALNKIKDGVKDVGGAAKDAAKEIEDAMKLLIEGLKTAADNLAEVFGNAFEQLANTGKITFSSFIKDLNNLIIKSTSELLQEELSNMFQSLATSRGGLGSAFSNLFTRIFGGGLPQRARGGVQMPFSDFIAGEEGPERIRRDGPSGAFRVSTAGQTRAQMNQRQQPVTININVSTPDVEGFRKSQPQIASRAAMFLSRARRNA